jgi:hypothetical protein
MKSRQNLYLDRGLCDALDRLAKAPGGNKSRIVNDALAAFLKRRASSELDELFGVRLDRMSRELERVGRDLEVLLESHALFVRYQLTVMAPVPEADAAAIAIGNARFDRFVAQLGRQLAAGKSSLTSLAEAS